MFKCLTCEIVYTSYQSLLKHSKKKNHLITRSQDTLSISSASTSLSSFSMSDQNKKITESSPLSSNNLAKSSKLLKKKLTKILPHEKKPYEITSSQHANELLPSSSVSNLNYRLVLLNSENKPVFLVTTLPNQTKTNLIESNLNR